VNTQKKELKLLKEACQKIKPERIQLNSLDRAGSVAGLKKAPLALLTEIVEFFKPLPVEII
jgi:wyosine [tRNA(Phe)-imidazoG37] synthetase (radical SAM superfamily)